MTILKIHIMIELTLALRIQGDIYMSFVTYTFWVW